MERAYQKYVQVTIRIVVDLNVIVLCCYRSTITANCKQLINNSANLSVNWVAEITRDALFKTLL